MRIGAVITAAGLSSRMGCFKPLLPYKNTTLIRHMITLVQNAGADPVVVVAGYMGNELKDHIRDMKVCIIDNPDYAHTQMFDSIRLGLTALQGTCDRAAYFPVDVPEISPELIRQVFLSDGRILRTTYQGRPGHPVVISARDIPAILSYQGDRGFRGALESLGCTITEIEASDDGIYRDLDTPEDYHKLVGTCGEERRLFLIRHGAVEFPDGIPLCIGQSDLPLSEAGQRQAVRLKALVQKEHITAIYTSPLSRCRATAGLMAGELPVQVHEGLTEIHMGEWEMVPRHSLKKSLTDEPLQGEGRRAALSRFTKAVDEIIAHTTGNIAVVSHAGVICAYLSQRMNSPLETSRALRQPYTAINTLTIRKGAAPRLESFGLRVREYPLDEEINELYRKENTPEAVIAHCRAVADEAMELCDRLQARGVVADRQLIRAACLLHDLSRTKKDHADRGAALLDHAGYPRLAGVIRQHMELDRVCLNEASVVFYADKCIRGTQRISPAERFESSRKKHVFDEEAQRAYDRRLLQLKQLEELMSCL